MFLCNLHSRVDRRRHDLLQRAFKHERRTNLWKSLESSVGYSPASVNFLCCVMVIANVSAQTAEVVERMLTLPTGISLHRLAEEQKHLLTTEAS